MQPHLQRQVFIRSSAALRILAVMDQPWRWETKQAACGAWAVLIRKTNTLSVVLASYFMDCMDCIHLCVFCVVCVCSKFICVCLKCRIRQACHSVVGHPDSSSFVRPLVWCQTPSSEAPLEVGERFNGSPTRRLPHGQDACGLLLGTSPPSGFRVPWTAEEHVAGSHQSLHFSCTYSLQRLQLQSLGVSLVPDVIHMVNHGALLAGTFPIYHSAA